jgi:hypothetical protein
VEQRELATGRARKAVISDFKGLTVLSTDGLKSFAGLPEAGFKHVPRSQPLRNRPAQRGEIGGALGGSCESAIYRSGSSGSITG